MDNFGGGGFDALLDDLRAVQSMREREAVERHADGLRKSMRSTAELWTSAHIIDGRPYIPVPKTDRRQLAKATSASRREARLATERVMRDLNGVQKNTDALLMRNLGARWRQGHDDVQAVCAKALAAVARGEMTATQASQIEAKANRVIAELDAGIAATARAIAAQAAAREARR